MTECNRTPLVFSTVSRRKIRADFDGGTLTSDAGGLVLREVDRRIGLIDQLTDCLTDPRDPAKNQHDQRTLLAQRIHGIALGCEDLSVRRVVFDLSSAYPLQRVFRQIQYRLCGTGLPA